MCEKIRISLKREQIATHLAVVSPTGSVGASASQRCPPDTRTAMTGKRKYICAPCVFAIANRLVILNAKRERIRIPLKGSGLPQPLTRLRDDESGRTDCHTPCGGLACRLGRCFCFAEVSTGHPHRNDESGKTDQRAHFGVRSDTLLNVFFTTAAFRAARLCCLPYRRL